MRNLVHPFFLSLLLLSYTSTALIYQQCTLEKVCIENNHITQICVHEGSGVEIKVWSSSQQYYTTKVPFAGINPRIIDACPNFRNLTSKKHLMVYDFAHYPLDELELSNDEKQLLRLTYDSLVIQERLTRNLEDIRSKRRFQMSSY